MKKSKIPQNNIAPVQYLPRTLVDYWSDHPDEKSPIWGKWLSGSLMHCDITGFTAMSEALGEAGKEGAELMASILNQFFERMLGIAEQWEGVQMKFGGDAMLLLFSGRQHAKDAAMCAAEMQRAMNEFRRVTVMGSQHPLKMRIGIHSGHFYSASVGQSDGHLHYLLFGVDVNKTALVEPHAQPGQVVTSEDTADLIRDSFTVIPTKVLGIWRVKTTDDSYQHTYGPKKEPVIKNILTRYLLPPLANGLISNLSGEHRRVTSVFINVLGASEILGKESEEAALAQTNFYLDALIGTLDKFGGYLAASDVAEEGEKFLILFGAPLSLDKQEEKALLFIDEFNCRLKQIEIRLLHKVGVNTGYAFAGEIGSIERKEYTVIGDSVNMAARLMGKANPGDTIISAGTAKRIGDMFKLKRKRAIRVKGKTEPISIFQFLGADQYVGASSSGSDFFVGRITELQKIQHLSSRVSEGEFVLLSISGESGIGKTSLAHRVIKELREKSWMILEGHGQSYLTTTPYGIWSQALKSLFDIHAIDSDIVAARKIAEVVKKYIPEYQDFAPLLAEIVAIEFDENEVVSALDAKDRHEKRLEIIPVLIDAICKKSPVLVFLDDAHWIDETSLTLLQKIVNANIENLFICMISKDPETKLESKKTKNEHGIKLSELKSFDAQQLVRHYLSLQDDKRIHEIIKRAKGNPLFLKELAQTSGVSDEELPASINEAIMVKVDNLDRRIRGLLRLAAVIGSSFEKETLHGLLDADHSKKYMNGDIDMLVYSGFINVLEDENRYQFSNNLVWEVVYETLLYVDRRSLHKQVAATIEARFSDALSSKAGALSYHHERAGNVEEALFHCASAGDNAAQLYAVSDALGYYQKALKFLEDFKDGRRVEKSAIQEKIADIYSVAGRHKEAAESLTQSLQMWKDSKRRVKLRNLPWKISASERESMLCQKVSEAHRENSSYDIALEWADDGLKVIPEKANLVKSKIYSTKSGIYFRQGNLKEAASWAKRAKSIAQRLKDKTDLGTSCTMIGLVYMWEGKIADAIREHGESASIYKELKNLPGIGTSNANLGVCYQLSGDLDRASENYKVALEAYSKIQNQTQLAAVSNNQGEVLLTHGQYDEAISNFEQTVNICIEKDALPLAGLALINLCRCKVVKGDYEKAEWYIRKAIRMLRVAGAEQLLQEAQLQQAELNVSSGHIERALRQNRALVKVLVQGDAKVLISRAHRIMAEIFLRKKKSDKAFEHIKKSIELASAIDAKHELARSIVVEAKIMSGLGDDSGEELSRKLSQASDLFSKIGAIPEENETKILIEQLIH